MKWVVDSPIHVGDFACAAVVEFDMTVRAVSHGMVASGKKRPVLILIFWDGIFTGLDIKGHVHEAEEIEELYPGAIGQLIEILGTSE